MVPPNGSAGADEAEYPFMKFEPLNFERKDVDSDVALFEGRRDAPDPSVYYALTITVASPGEGTEAAAELLRFLDGIRAGFTLTDPNPSVDDDQEPEPEPEFDVDNEVLFELKLVPRRTLDLTFGCTAVVKTRIPDDDSPADEDFSDHAAGSARPGAARPGPLGARTVNALKYHRWTANKSRPATVTATGGRGLVGTTKRRDALLPFFKDGPEDSIRHVTGKTVWVLGDRWCAYTISTNFNGPYEVDI
jgi:hypothetical protein